MPAISELTWTRDRNGIVSIDAQATCSHRGRQTFTCVGVVKDPDGPCPLVQIPRPLGAPLVRQILDLVESKPWDE